MCCLCYTLFGNGPQVSICRKNESALFNGSSGLRLPSLWAIEHIPSLIPSVIASFPLRSVTKLLEDLVYFVTGGTNSGQDVLEVVFSKPNRERQKLMREQNILKQVGYR